MKRIRTENINTLEHWDKEWTDRKPELIERFTMVAEMLRRVGAKKVLDIGCGNNLGYDHLKRHYDVVYYGTDFSEAAIEKAKASGNGGNYAVADVYSQPFDSESFDAVLCQEVFEHIENPQQLATEMMRLVRPGGTIIITTPLGGHLNGCEEHIWAYDKDDFRTFFEGCKVQFLKNDELFPDLIIGVITKPV